VLHVLETDDGFGATLREFFYDFSIGALTDARPRGTHRYLRMRVRADVFRHVLRHQP
jgi:hypothetical protein